MGLIEDGQSDADAADTEPGPLPHGDRLPEHGPGEQRDHDSIHSLHQYAAKATPAKAKRPAALDEWLIAAGVLDSAARCDAAALARAVELREAVYRLALATSLGEPWRDADRLLVNRIADGPKPSITRRADAGVTRRGECDHALARIATAVIELLGGPDRDRIEQCGRDTCTRLYRDTSRAGSRRWWI
ncbi:hypothetical protein C5E45_05700 [Nocardia nova]|uniref:Zinc finger CGNR domain-containing protein n=1 Tax=Nocardia nova TaxID=37330 RepID=A0A2S6AUU3_9NOCA|nr:CGNR zinc finger domain-containing protein [Nocardia nova]PPJ32493.1 hypothetical protein C5E41_05020 [Nocardia nova]PPJ38996.1 hypothetical protein C5E45_05700 [Nocardia nova]